MRRALPCLLLVTASAATAQNVQWGRMLLETNSVNSNVVQFVAPLPAGRILVDIRRHGFRIESSVIDAGTGTLDAAYINPGPAIDSSQVLASSGDLIRYSQTQNGVQPRGNLYAIDPVTGATKWEKLDQSLRFQLNTDNAGNVYVLEHEGIGYSSPLHIKRIDGNGVVTPIADMATYNATVIPLDRVGGMPGWAIHVDAGHQLCRLGASLTCNTLLVSPSDLITRVIAAPGGGAYAEILRPTVGWDLAYFSDIGVLLWQRRVSGMQFSFGAFSDGVALLVADDFGCAINQVAFRTLATDGTPSAEPSCVDDLGSGAASAKFFDLGEHWAYVTNTGTPRVIEKQSGHAYWLRLPPVRAERTSFNHLFGLANGQIGVVCTDWENQQRDYISIRRVQLVDTLFQDNLEYFEP